MDAVRSGLFEARLGIPGMRNGSVRNQKATRQTGGHAEEKRMGCIVIDDEFPKHAKYANKMKRWEKIESLKSGQSRARLLCSIFCLSHAAHCLSYR